jgi:FSR family fosmidomycin resistance protein-like MFS transporter
VFKNKNLHLLSVSHLLVDFFTGVWAIYKTLAQINIAQAALITGISGFIGELLQVFFGYFCDRGHRRITLLIGLGLSSCIIWVTFVDNIFGLFFLLLALMIGSSAFHPAATGIAAGLSHDRKGQSILFFSFGGAIGFGISQLAFSQILRSFDGHAYILALPVLATFFLLFFHKFPGASRERPVFSWKTFSEPFYRYRKELILLYLSQVFYQGLRSSLFFLLPDLFLLKGYHSWICMGGGHLCFVAGSTLTMLPAGYLSDRFGQKSVLLIVLFATIALFYTFLMLDTLPFAWALLLLMSLGAFFGIINPLVISWGNYLIPESPSTVSALLMGFAWCVGNLGPACAGLLIPLFSENAYIHTLLTMGLLLVLVFFFILIMPKRKALVPTHTTMEPNT